MATQAPVELLTKTISKFAIMKANQHPSKRNQIFDAETTDMRILDGASWIGYRELPDVVRPRETVTESSMDIDFGYRAVIADYAMADSVAYADWEDDQYGVFARLLPQKGGAMGVNHELLHEWVCAEFINNYGFASGTSVAGMPDGVSIFNTAHPYSKVDTSNTWSNRPATDTDLSIAAYKAASTALRRQPQASGLGWVAAEPSKLVINPTNHYTALELFKGMYQAGSPNLTPNTLAAEAPQIVEWNWFDANSGDAWFLIGNENPFKELIRSPVKFMHVDKPENFAHLFLTWDRFTVYIETPRGTYGSYGG